MTRWLVALVGTLLADVSVAETSFGRLATWCGSIPIEKLEDAFRAGRCVGYLEGAPDGIDIGEQQMKAAIKPRGGHWAPLRPCIPESVTSEQIARMVVKYAEAHPETLHLSGADGVQRMLREAFPCVQ